MGKKNEVMAQYVEEFAHDDLRQFMDCGKSIPKNLEVSGKALGLINIMKGFGLGYTVSYSDLINRKWQKWIKGNPKFKASEVLSSQDVKKAIRGFYAMVARGELQFKDGQKKMLEFIQTNTGNSTVEFSIRVSEFREGLFTLSESEEETEKADEGSKILKALEKLVKAEGITDAEKKAIENAISEIKKPSAVIVKAA